MLRFNGTDPLVLQNDRKIENKYSSKKRLGTDRVMVTQQTNRNIINENCFFRKSEQSNQTAPHGEIATPAA